MERRGGNVNLLLVLRTLYRSATRSSTFIYSGIQWGWNYYLRNMKEGMNYLLQIARHVHQGVSKLAKLQNCECISYRNIDISVNEKSRISTIKSEDELQQKMISVKCIRTVYSALLSKPGSTSISLIIFQVSRSSVWPTFWCYICPLNHLNELQKERGCLIWWCNMSTRFYVVLQVRWPILEPEDVCMYNCMRFSFAAVLPPPVASSSPGGHEGPGGLIVLSVASSHYFSVTLPDTSSFPNIAPPSWSVSPWINLRGARSWCLAFLYFCFCFCFIWCVIRVYHDTPCLLYVLFLFAP